MYIDTSSSDEDSSEEVSSSSEEQELKSVFSSDSNADFLPETESAIKQ